MASCQITGIPFVDSLTDLSRSRLGLDDPSTPVSGIAEAAMREGVAGFLYYDAGRTSDVRLREAARVLTPWVRRYTIGMLAFRDLFSRIVAKCEEVDAPIMLLKGLALTEWAYKECGSRRMGDIDFLIHARDWSRVSQAMSETGLTPLTSVDAMGPATNMHNVDWHTDTGLKFEPHWNIVPLAGPFPVKPEELWSDATPIDFCGHSAYVLSPEKFLLHACIHVHFHGYRHSMSDFFDVYALVLQSPELQWDMLAEQARRWNAGSVLYLVLLEMSRLFKVDSTTQEHILSLCPRGIAQQRIIMPILQRAITSHRPEIDESSARIASSPSDMENLLLAIVGGQARSLVRWFWPSRNRLFGFYGIGPDDWSWRYYVLYYVDILRRLATSIRRFRGASTTG